MKHLLTLSIAGLFFFLTACSNNASEKTPATKDSSSAFDLSTAKKIIEQKDEEWSKAVSTPDSIALVHHFTKNASILPPNGESIVGEAAIASFASQVMKFGIKFYQDSIVELSGCNDKLIEQGVYKMGDGKGNTLDKGKYIAIWEKEDGDWKIKTNMYNSNLPLPSAKK